MKENKQMNSDITDSEIENQNKNSYFGSNDKYVLKLPVEPLFPDSEYVLLPNPEPYLSLGELPEDADPNDNSWWY